MICNVIGEDYPADAVKFDAFEISLCSGTAEATEIVKSTMVDEFGDPCGGYYDETWHGIGQVMLPKFKYDPVHHGSAVAITLQFLNEEPRAMREFGKQSSYAVSNSVSSSTLSPKNNKKRKVKVNSEY